MNKNTEAIYDAKQLGTANVIILGLQHMFAMFGSTVLVPLLTGLSVSTTLLFVGVGTLLFHLVTKGKVPAFLGSSFAFLGGYAAIAPLLEDGSSNVEMIPYACFGVACAGLVYLVMAGMIKLFSAKKVMKFFPPIVTGPIIIAIGLILSKSAIDNCTANWWLAILAIVVIIVCNIWGKGMIKIIPILLGVVVSYVVAAVTGNVDFTAVKEAAWIGLPVAWEDTALSLFGKGNVSLIQQSKTTAEKRWFFFYAAQLIFRKMADIINK
jgi:uracil permease